MIAIAILASLTALMWSSISTMFSTRDVVRQRAERYQQVRVTMSRMTQELSMAYMAGPQFGGEDLPGEETFGEAAAADGDAEAAALAATREKKQFGFIGKNDRVDFTSFAHVRTQPGERAGDHAEIGYFIRSKRDEETGRLVKQLVRREDTTLDDDITHGGTLYTMLPEVEDVKFEYYDPGPVELGTYEEMAQGRWVDSWDTTNREFAGRLPPRVRITLILPPGPFSDRPEKFTTQTTIQVTEVLEF